MQVRNQHAQSDEVFQLILRARVRPDHTMKNSTPTPADANTSDNRTNPPLGLLPWLNWLGRHHWRVSLLRPDFAGLADSLETLISFYFVWLGTKLVCLRGFLDQDLSAGFLVVIYQTAGFAAMTLVMRHLKYSSSLVSVIIVGSTLNNLVALVVGALLKQPDRALSLENSISELILVLIMTVLFHRQPAAVRARGYMPAIKGGA